MLYKTVMLIIHKPVIAANSIILYYLLPVSMFKMIVKNPATTAIAMSPIDITTNVPNKIKNANAVIIIIVSFLKI